ncbi:hypothetical protein [Nocardia arthritidis]|uniref:hypothetical protein n=1 Tax=Nocardia arthritidis TaxID=228602 RepID=UPI000A963910|nr:hypothetical protein [Nocardia arthritidis]
MSFAADHGAGELYNRERNNVTLCYPGLIAALHIVNSWAAQTAQSMIIGDFTVSIGV